MLKVRVTELINFFS